MQLTTIRLEAANDFVDRLHRHHKRVQGHKFSLAAWSDGKIVGVVIVGRPVARKHDSGVLLEVTRLCTDGTRNACSFLYAAAERATRALGYFGLQTFTLEDESGASLRGAGWNLTGKTTGKSWSVPTRPRVDRHQLGLRNKWGVAL